MYGKKIKSHMNERGLKYSFVANEIGMPMNIFSALLNDKRKMSIEEYVDICKVLEVSVEHFTNLNPVLPQPA